MCGPKPTPSNRPKATSAANTGTLKKSYPSVKGGSAMPNWCTTAAVVTGEATQVAAFGKLLQELEALPESLLPNGFGKLWCGNIVHKLGADWNEVYCRGWITDYDIAAPDRINLSVESAWGELSEVRKLILTHYPGLRIFYESEEPGMLVFESNDVDGLYFKDRYILDFCDESRHLWLWEYFTTLEAAADFVSKNCLDGKPVDADKAKINEALDAYQGEHPDDVSFIFEAFKLVND